MVSMRLQGQAERPAAPQTQVGSQAQHYGAASGSSSTGASERGLAPAETVIKLRVSHGGHFVQVGAPLLPDPVAAWRPSRPPLA